MGSEAGPFRCSTIKSGKVTRRLGFFAPSQWRRRFFEHHASLTATAPPSWQINALNRCIPSRPAQCEPASRSTVPAPVLPRTHRIRYLPTRTRSRWSRGVVNQCQSTPHLGNMVEGLAPHAFLSGLIPGHSPSSRNLAGEMSLSCNDSSSSLNLVDSTVRAL